MDDMSEYKKMYAIESAEHLQTMNEALLCLEKDAHNSNTINEMFRAAHTLKGMSATMGYSNISELTHKMENLMDRVRKNEINLDAEAVDILFECLDSLEEMSASPEHSAQCDISQLIQKVLLITNKETDVKITEKQPEGAKHKTPDNIMSGPINPDIGCNVFEVMVTLEESCTLKYARSTVIIRNLSELGEIIGTNPPAKDMENEKFGHEFGIIVSTKEDAKKIEDAVKKAMEVAKVEVKLTQPASQATMPREKVIAEKEKATVKSLQSVRVSIERLDSLMNLVGELVINKIRLMQLASDYKIEALEEALAGLDRLSGELQNEVMASRMVPLEQIFNRFPRMVRDIAKIEGKDIELAITGSNIELDRTVLDEIGDPLVHILRNCVDHGIESPELRKQHGKNHTGTIRLAAWREKNYVAIEIEDDGKGMDPRKFREIAVNKGIMTQEEAARLSDTEALNLSYLPGFTTAEKVTEISGRGVGLDVVRTRIEGMGGSVKLESKIGEGTKIALKLPLTVAIIHSQMVRVGKNIYAIPIANVVRDISIKRSQIKTVESEAVVMMMDEVLPLIWLQDLFGVKSNGSDQLVVVVVERMGSNVGLVVDQLIGQQEVIIKTLESKILKGIKGFAGATILGDGNVALIIDVGTLL